ncbi:MAG: DUF3093 family protein, partial [Candidatus Nanopelagicaceae bacterium]
MPRYREVLNPPLSWMGFIFFMYLSLAFAIWAAFDYYQALVTFLLLSASLPLLWFKMRMVITVDMQLRIDRAHIELNYLKNARVVDESEYRKLRTFNSDARSFHATRPWIKSGIQVFVNDERDQTSYWLIGTKKGEKLVAALI